MRARKKPPIGGYLAISNVNSALLGEQMAAQALCAANALVDGRRPHSLHAYCLRPGTADYGVLDRVERLREGKNFATRRVVAWEAGVSGSS